MQTHNLLSDALKGKEILSKMLIHCGKILNTSDDCSQTLGATATDQLMSAAIKGTYAYLCQTIYTSADFEIMLYDYSFLILLFTNGHKHFLNTS